MKIDLMILTLKCEKRKKKERREEMHRRRQVELKLKPPENVVSSFKVTYATISQKHKHRKDVFGALKEVVHYDIPKDPNVVLLGVTAEGFDRRFKIKLLQKGFPLSALQLRGGNLILYHTTSRFKKVWGLYAMEQTTYVFRLQKPGFM